MVCATGTTNGGVWVFTDMQIPVELTGFTAAAKNGQVELNWTTATELNNSGFEILRCNENENEWATIGFVPGFGSSLKLIHIHLLTMILQQVNTFTG